MIVDGSPVQITYTAETGFTKTPITYNYRGTERVHVEHFEALDRSISDQDLESIITKFLEDYAIIFGIATDAGFEMLMSGFKSMLKN